MRVDVQSMELLWSVRVSSHRRPESDSSENFVESVPAAYNAHNYAYPRYGTRRNHTRAGHCSSSRGVRSRTDARGGSGHRAARCRVETSAYHLKEKIMKPDEASRTFFNKNRFEKAKTACRHPGTSAKTFFQNLSILKKNNQIG